MHASGIDALSQRYSIQLAEPSPGAIAAAVRIAGAALLLAAGADLIGGPESLRDLRRASRSAARNKTRTLQPEGG